MALAELYSGIVINQNRYSPSTVGGLGPLVPISSGLFQTFTLPSDYPRAETVAPLTGLQLFVLVESGQAVQASLTWEFDVLAGGRWTVLATGSSTGAALDGRTWFNVFFPAPVDVNDIWQNPFRLLLLDSANIEGVYYAHPNPITTGGATLGGSASLPILLTTDASLSLSLTFRVLAAVADSGIDFLGNTYRSVAVASAVGQVNPASPPLVAATA